MSPNAVPSPSPSSPALSTLSDSSIKYRLSTNFIVAVLQRFSMFFVLERFPCLFLLVNYWTTPTRFTTKPVCVARALTTPTTHCFSVLYGSALSNLTAAKYHAMPLTNNVSIVPSILIKSPACNVLPHPFGCFQDCQLELLQQVRSLQPDLAGLLPLRLNRYWWWIPPYQLCWYLALNVLRCCLVETVAWWCWIGCWNVLVKGTLCYLVIWIGCPLCFTLLLLLHAIH